MDRQRRRCFLNLHKWGDWQGIQIVTTMHDPVGSTLSFRQTKFCERRYSYQHGHPAPHESHMVPADPDEIKWFPSKAINS